MLEALTPGATIVISACSCLMCLGVFWSLHIYFLPYLRQRRAEKQPILPQAVQSAIDQELYTSLYDFPQLLYHCPRESLTACELKSSKWSTTVYERLSLRSPHESVYEPRQVLEKKRHQGLSSTSRSILRQSLISETSLAMPTEKSCSTITTIGHAGNAVPQPVKKYRKSMHSFSESSGGVPKVTSRRHSAPTVLLIERSLNSVAATDGSLSTAHISPTATSFSSVPKEQNQEQKKSRFNGEEDSLKISISHNKYKTTWNLDVRLKTGQSCPPHEYPHLTAYN